MVGALRPVALALAPVLALATSAALLSACQASRTPPPAAPSADELANATYAGIYPEPVTLVDGAWEGEPFEPGGASAQWTALVRNFRLVGDLDGRPGAEAVVLLSENSGGSGTFFFVAVVGRRDGEAVNLGTAYVGDRAEVRHASISDGNLVLRVVEAGPDDPACCPSQKAIRTFALSSESPVSQGEDPAGLVEVSHEITGTLSLADLEGVEWVLTQLGQDQPAPAAPELTLRVDGARVSGASGCNRYFAAAEAGPMPSDIRIGPMGSTRMMCPQPQMRLEQQFLAALESATRYGFAAGRLYLLTRDPGAFSTLLFESRPTIPEPTPEPGSGR